MIELSIVVPTYNEKHNISKLVERMNIVLDNVNWEIIFVDDDSPDGTADEVRKFAQNNSNIRIIHRINRRGLSSACIEGVMSSSAQYVAIMDANLQHDESILPEMLQAVKNNGYNISVGSRFIKGGSASNGLNRTRQIGSSFAIWLSKLVLNPVQLNDSMSGFFLFKRYLFVKYARCLSGKGFKILLDFCCCAKHEIRLKEIGYDMRSRYSGASKMDYKVVIEYLILLLEHSIGRIIPLRFIFFVAVGASGLIFHVINLFVLYKKFQYNFYTSQLVSTFLSMNSNFFINNSLTYRDKKLKGKKLILGLLSFILICSIGMYVNLTIACRLSTVGINWILSGILGAGISAVWNYAVSSTLTWKKNG